eukprot:SAG11_NODE_25335_length_360_cov_0.785441_1_plen_27_part_01
MAADTRSIASIHVEPIGGGRIGSMLFS